jgi:hypothetical protein
MQADDGFDDAVLGQGLPPLAEAALAEAGACRSSDPSRAMAALMRAQALAPLHPAVLIALYRHHFYGHRLGPARDVARRGLALAAGVLGLPALWRELPDRPIASMVADPQVDVRTDARVRFHLFLLKGYAYLSLRLGDEVEARDALAKLAALDPQDFVGHRVLEAVRVRALVGDAADDPSDD